MGKAIFLVTILGLGATMLLAFHESVSASNAGSRSQSERTEELEVRISPPESVVVLGETLRLRVEILNNGRQDVLVCKDFLSGACDLRFSFDPVARVPHAVVSKDCTPYEWSTHAAPPRNELERILVEDWVPIAPQHFYGVAVNLEPTAYPELQVAGNYRVSGRFSSGGFLDQYCYYKLKPFSKEVTDLPTKSWRGAVSTNAVLVRVSSKKH